MKSVLISTALLGFACHSYASILSSADWPSFHTRVSESAKKSPDERVNYSRWSAEGVYALFVCSEEESFEQLYEFDKTVDEQAGKFRIAAFPLRDRRLAPHNYDQGAEGYRKGKGKKKRGEEGIVEENGPLVMYGDREHVYVIRPRLPDWWEGGAGGDDSDTDNIDLTRENHRVVCTKHKAMRKKRMDPIKKAKYTGLAFSHNTLCNRYVDLDLPTSGGCKVEESECHINAFNHHLVDVAVRGTLEHRGKKHHSSLAYQPRQYGFEEESTELEFMARAFMSRFCFDEQGEKKDLLTLPDNLEEICQESDEDDELHPAIAVFQQL
jgi:hypothetical protein